MKYSKKVQDMIKSYVKTYEAICLIDEICYEDNVAFSDEFLQSLDRELLDLSDEFFKKENYDFSNNSDKEFYAVVSTKHEFVSVSDLYEDLLPLYEEIMEMGY